jgi:hypothetical protein
VVGATGIGNEAAQLRPVANPPQPCRDDSERLIAGEEAGHQHDGTAVTARHVDAIQDGVGQQAGEF